MPGDKALNLLLQPCNVQLLYRCFAAEQQQTCVMDTEPALEHLAQAQDLRQRPVAALEPRQALVNEQVDLRSQGAAASASLLVSHHTLGLLMTAECRHSVSQWQSSVGLACSAARWVRIMY